MPHLTQRLVTQYAKLQALKNMIEKWVDLKRAEIIAALKSGEACPSKGPFLLELGEAARSPKWKDEFASYLAETIGDEAAAKKMAEIAQKDRGKDDRIYSRANPNFQRKFPIRLPI